MHSSVHVPQEALELVFSYISEYIIDDVPNELEFLATCALVCHAWRTAAAAAACTDITFDLADLAGLQYSDDDDDNDDTKDEHLARVRSLTRWLTAHGSSVQHLHVSGPGVDCWINRQRVKIALPFMQLHQLQSFTCDNWVLAEQRDEATSSSSSSAASESGSGPLSSLTSLTALELAYVRLDWRADIQGIGALTRLRQLHLIDVDGYSNGCGEDEFSPFLQLTQLTALTIRCAAYNSPVEVAVVAQLTGLRSLELSLKRLTTVEAACLLPLTNLTKLAHIGQSRAYTQNIQPTAYVNSSVQ
jgi:hypothetical protein